MPNLLLVKKYAEWHQSIVGFVSLTVIKKLTKSTPFFHALNFLKIAHLQTIRLFLQTLAAIALKSVEANAAMTPLQSFKKVH